VRPRMGMVPGVGEAGDLRAAVLCWVSYSVWRRVGVMRPKSGWRNAGARRNTGTVEFHSDCGEDADRFELDNGCGVRWRVGAAGFAEEVVDFRETLRRMARAVVAEEFLGSQMEMPGLVAA